MEGKKIYLKANYKEKNINYEYNRNIQHESKYGAFRFKKIQ